MLSAQDLFITFNPGAHRDALRSVMRWSRRGVVRHRHRLQLGAGKSTSSNAISRRHGWTPAASPSTAWT